MKGETTVLCDNLVIVRTDAIGRPAFLYLLKVNKEIISLILEGISSQ